MLFAMDPLAGLSRLAEVADGVFVATAQRWQTTSTVVLSAERDSALVIDPALDGTELAALGADLGRLGTTVALGFSTHAHFDHVLWHASLGQAPRIATAKAAAYATAHRADLADEARRFAPGVDPACVGQVRPLPAQGEPPRVDWTGREVLVLESDAHAPGHASCWLPDVGVLVAGDLCSDVEIPLLDLAGADPIGAYRFALVRLAELRGVRAVVPGHGSVGDGPELERRITADLAYLDHLQGHRPFDDGRLARRSDLVVDHQAQLTWAGAR